MADYFFIGYTGNKKAKVSDYSNYSTQELKNMMKSQAKRLNTRLATLEKENMRGYAYQQAQRFAHDELQYMRGSDEQPRFKTAVNEYLQIKSYETIDGKQQEVYIDVKDRERTREEIIEQLVAMEKWESLTTSTVSGMMETYEAKYEEVKKRDPSLTFEKYVDIATSNAYDIIQTYYGSTTAYEIVKTYGNTAASAYIADNPELFQADNKFNGQGLTLFNHFTDWYKDNWENTRDSVSDEEARDSVLDIGY